MRGGVIQAAGPESQVAIPPDARVFDLKGKTLCAAFIDPYVSADRLSGVSGFEFGVRAPNSKL